MNHSVIGTLGLQLRNKYCPSDVNRVTNLKAQPLHIFISPILVVMSLLRVRVSIVVRLLPGDNRSRFLGRKVRKARGTTKWDENTDIRHAPLKGFIRNGCKGTLILVDKLRLPSSSLWLEVREWSLFTGKRIMVGWRRIYIDSTEIR